MIGKLRGIIDRVRDDHLIVDVQGVGYLVFASSRTLQSLQSEASEVTLYIETHVREDHIHLYGFMSEAEQEMFLTLTTVQGVGAKMGLAILSVFEAAEIGNIILAQDKTSLTRVSGVGKRIAERIVTELKNKLPALEAAISPAAPSGGTVAASVGASDISDAVSALENLGYPRVNAMQAAQAAKAEGAESLDDMIKVGLQKLTG